MLSRIAEALFWIGRYVERADGTARLLDVHLQLLLEDPRVDEHTMCSTLLAVMGAPPVEEGPARRADVVRQLVLDGEHTASVAHSISAARENARRAREIISAELWRHSTRPTTGCRAGSQQTAPTRSSGGSGLAQPLPSGWWTRP